MPLRMQGHFDMMPAPRFATVEEMLAGVPPAEAIEIINSGVLRGQRQLARKFFDLSAFLEEYVANLIDSGAPFPNLSRNGNFLNSQPEAPLNTPDFWAGYPLGGGEPICGFAAPPANVPGQAVIINIIGGGGAPVAQGIRQRIQISNEKKLCPSLYYKTTSAIEGARVTLEETATSTSVARDLPATGGQWRFWPCAGDAPISIATGNGVASPFTWINIGSVNTPAVTQAISFAGVSMTEGYPALWKPGTFDQATCQGEYVAQTWKTYDKAATDILDGMAAAGPSMIPMVPSGVYPANNANYQGRCVGIANEDIYAGAPGRLLEGGVKDKANWAAVVGADTLLAGSKYFLGTNGLLTATPDTVSDGSKILQVVGEAISKTKMKVRPGPVRLL